MELIQFAGQTEREIKPCADRFSFIDVEENSITTSTPETIIYEMWSMWWLTVKETHKVKLALRMLPMGEELLIESIGMRIRKHYRIV